MSNKMDKALLKIRDFVWDSDSIDCSENNCPLENICRDATNRELSCGLCSEFDEKFLWVVKEIEEPSKALISMKEFFEDNCYCSDEGCPLYSMCENAYDKELTNALCGETDDKFISIIGECCEDE